ncbi:hypothetical protein LH128_07602 [Sphingomonas sp. LH128]|uniref:hypothetical protein n=1 Tax=Sphingomonas sp. LH128 TaxID=473781 RepID=UPI00027CC4E6|nr:hypothetical protein [Sphingomonas sp. LH128]EJU13661.1 hypothetical protein LH128_07602 [Sphingomonas sp. LH128]
MATTAKTRAAKLRAKEMARIGEINRLAWARRHPDLARQERELRLFNRDVKAGFGHKVNGTPETHAKASLVRQGALARLYEAGDIDAEQLAASVSIAAVHARITGPVTVGTVSYETRVDQSGGATNMVFERLGAVRAEVTYSHWRQQIAEPAVVLAMIVEDLGVTRAAAKFRMRNAKAKKLLTYALDLWIEMNRRVCRDIDDASLAAAQAGIL